MKISQTIKSLLVVITLALSFSWLSSPVFANFGSDSYGQCAYNEACPATVDPNNPDDNDEPTTPNEPGDNENPTTPNTPEDPDNPQNPDRTTDPEDSDQPDSGNDGGNPNNPTNPNNTSPNEPGDNTINIYSKSAMPERTLSSRILMPGVKLMNFLPHGPRLASVYMPWLILLILSIVMLVIAYIDRRRSKKLEHSITLIKSALQQQKTFLRLALHHLNTPLATIQNVLELMQSAKPPDPAATQLNPIALKIESAVLASTDSLTTESQAISSETEKLSKTNVRSSINNWYFVIPVLLSVVFTIYINLAINQTDVSKPGGYVALQIIISMMICAVLFSAYRLRTLSKKRIIILDQLHKILLTLDDQRKILIDSLKDKLTASVAELDKASSSISNPSILRILKNSSRNLTTLVLKIKLATIALVTSPSEFKIDNNIQQIVDAVKEIKSDTIAEKYITINTVLGQDIIQVPEIETRFIINSLVENAIDHSKNGGYINITGSLDESVLKILVADNGSGISKQKQDLIFKPFSSDDDVLTYNNDGMGLSLFTVKSVLSKLGGSLTIESEPEKGTTIKVNIPISKTTFEE